MGERLMDIAEPIQVTNQKQYNVNSWHVLASTSQFLPTRANQCFFFKKMEKAKLFATQLI